MNKLLSFCSEKLSVEGGLGKNEIEFKKAVGTQFASYGIYPSSVHAVADGICFVAKENTVRYFVITGKESEGFQAVPNGLWNGGKICPLSVDNGKKLMELFPFTKPSAVLGESKTIGLGDRLGLATYGHIEVVKDTDFKPIFAQQSMRELNLTGRDYPKVLNDAAWAVFTMDYRGGYGADGDHLKTKKDISEAINDGYTMITLDCSDYIDNSANEMENARHAYMKLDEALRKRLEETYLNKTFEFGISYPEQLFYKTALTYVKAIAFATDVYNTLIKGRNPRIDFELSIDETIVPTSPEAHYYVASELKYAGVECQTVAPRFCGEFQKGIDYIGDLGKFKEEFDCHAKIAKLFGYKISVHSGSDKFSVFPTVGELSEGKFHLKTAGTNWLEAVRVIAQVAPDFYRTLHKKALDTLDEARKFYHIKAEPSAVTPLDDVSDENLPKYLDNDDARQIIHITYGFILQDPVLKEKLYRLLYDNEEAYAQALISHIGNHITKLNGILATENISRK